MGCVHAHVLPRATRASPSLDALPFPFWISAGPLSSSSVLEVFGKLALLLRAKTMLLLGILGIGLNKPHGGVHGWRYRLDRLGGFLGDGRGPKSKCNWVMIWGAHPADRSLGVLGENNSPHSSFRCTARDGLHPRSL
jgi:hypothetical protein